ncbi:TadE/TadG family type IV pilus assembly protein [Hypericibacter sp.]|uniref:TadE/TadG family type IV pilus assembly protein n=1 Tax=Hypericibacter sp. TaxID=2705401 RepID=UPI003D6CA446
MPRVPERAAKALSGLHRFARAQSGSAALEFALALPPLILLIIGMFEVAVAMFVSTSVENGLREASRFGITGDTPADMSRQDQILAIIEANSFGMLDPDTTSITFMKYASFQDVGQPEPFVDTPAPSPNHNGKYDIGENYTDINGNGKWDDDRGIAGVGNSGEVVRYKVDYQWRLMTPLLSDVLGDNGVFHMSASVVVRNEPYAVVASGG